MSDSPNRRPSKARPGGVKTQRCQERKHSNSKLLRHDFLPGFEKIPLPVDLSRPLGRGAHRMASPGSALRQGCEKAERTRVNRNTAGGRSRPRPLPGAPALHEMRSALLRELQEPRSQLTFDNARARSALLRAHRTPLSLLGVLRRSSRANWADKDKLTHALLQEYSRHPDSLWTALLIVAYLPMLARLRRRIRASRQLSGELDLIIVEAFSQVVANYYPQRWRSYACVRLRQQTARAVFREIRQETKREALCVGSDVTDLVGEPLPAWSHLPPHSWSEMNVHERSQLLDWLRKHAANLIGRSKLELVISTVLLGEDLRAYVARTRPALPPEPATREYARLKRERSRTLSSLKTALQTRVRPH